MKIVKLFRRIKEKEVVRTKNFDFLNHKRIKPEVAQTKKFADLHSLKLKEVMPQEDENTYEAGRQKCLPSNSSGA